MQMYEREQVITEARAIAAGETMRRGTTGHVTVLMEQAGEDTGRLMDIIGSLALRCDGLLDGEELEDISIIRGRWRKDG